MNEPPDESAAGGAALFDEKSFYLEEFYGKSLLFALIPPSGERLGELDSLVRTLRELAPQSGAMHRDRLGRRARADDAPARAGSRPGPSLRSSIPARACARAPIRPTRRWRKSGARSARDRSWWRRPIPASRPISPSSPQELASRLRVFKLILLDRQGGLTGSDGERMSFVELGRIARAVRKQRTARRRAELRAVARALRDGVGSVNLVAPREVYDELFSFIGTGTLFTERQYGFVRPISIDDFEEVEALIVRGQREGHLLARSREEIAQLLPSCFGYRVGDEHLAGVCSLLTERYHRERAGEITALYTLTRFAGEGVAVELVKQILNEARERPLRYVFACTAEERAAKFFARLGFRRVGPRDIPPAKWRGYDRARMSRLEIFRYDLD